MEKQNTARPERPVGGRFAKAAVVASVLLMLGLISFLWTRWARVQEPTTAIVINGDPSLDGAKIMVTPLEEQGQTYRPVEVVLARDNAFRTAIFRYPGRYHVSISIPWRKSPLWEGDVALDRLRGVMIELPTVITVIGDGSMNGQQVRIQKADGTPPTTAAFDKHNNDRLRFVVLAGKYTLTVDRGGANVFDNELTVQSHEPQEIDVRKVP